jgi:hypothetical protein
MKPHITFDSNERLVTLHTEQADLTISFTVFRQMFANGGEEAVVAVFRADPWAEAASARETLECVYGADMSETEEAILMKPAREQCAWARQTSERNAYWSGWRDRAALLKGMARSATLKLVAPPPVVKATSAG